MDKKDTLPKCGIIMPISSIDNCPAEHWSEVLSILRDVINSVGFEPNLVSDADDIGIIQKRIIQNLYSNEIVVCDVSCKNPNVMFELGIRLAFDKPTIIIKDDKTDYSFDTSIIEHLSYPRDLRFNKIVAFKENLKKKIEGTYSKFKNDNNYTTFLKNFGEYKVAQLAEKEVTSDKYIMSSLEELKTEVFQIKRNQIIQNDLLKPKRTSIKSRKDEAFFIIGRLIEEFLSLNSMNDKSLLLTDNDAFEKLYFFVEQKDEVRRVCEGPDEVKEIVISYLKVPF